jgi:DNA modification methylase
VAVTLIHGDCVEVMAGMDPESVDAIVCDPPYGLEFMGKEWDKLGRESGSEWSPKWATGKDWKGQERQRPGRLYNRSSHETCQLCRKQKHQHDDAKCPVPEFVREWHKPRQMQAMTEWHTRWAEAAYRVAKPSAYLLAFGGTRTVHRMTVALEDAGWIIRDMLVWGYASGFPKSKASLKPAWEPIVMARKPGPLRMLAIDECRIAAPENVGVTWTRGGASLVTNTTGEHEYVDANPAGRWPANIVLTDPIFDGGVEGVVGGGESYGQPGGPGRQDEYPAGIFGADRQGPLYFDGGGTYSRFFLIPKAARADREPVLGGNLPIKDANKWNAGGIGEARRQAGQSMRENVHPTVKPTDLMRHLVRLVTPAGGVVLDPFLGSGTTALAAEMEGFAWIGIEREAEYVAIAEARLNGTQRGLGLEAS